MVFMWTGIVFVVLDLFFHVHAFSHRVIAMKSRLGNWLVFEYFGSDVSVVVLIVRPSSLNPK